MKTLHVIFFFLVSGSLFSQTVAVQTVKFLNEFTKHEQDKLWVIEKPPEDLRYFNKSLDPDRWIHVPSRESEYFSDVYIYNGDRFGYYSKVRFFEIHKNTLWSQGELLEPLDKITILDTLDTRVNCPCTLGLARDSLQVDSLYIEFEILKEHFYLRGLVPISDFLESPQGLPDYFEEEYWVGTYQSSKNMDALYYRIFETELDRILTRALEEKLQDLFIECCSEVYPMEMIVEGGERE